MVDIKSDVEGRGKGKGKGMVVKYWRQMAPHEISANNRINKTYIKIDKNSHFKNITRIKHIETTTTTTSTIYIVGCVYMWDDDDI